MTTLQKIRAKIIEAVPDISAGYWFGGDTPYDPYPGWINHPRISLADVLRAIEFEVPMTYARAVHVDGSDRLYMQHDETGNKTSWNLALPLDEQEPAVHEFLAEVFSV